MKRTFFFILALIAIDGSAGCKKSNTTSAPYYPTDSLAAYFNFENSSINDVVAHATGTNHNSAAFVTGVHGMGISFNGVDQYLEYTNLPITTPTGISFSMWMKTDTTNPTTYFLNSYGYGFYTSSWATGFAAYLPSTNSAGGLFHSQQWTHVVGTYDGNDIRIYINGILTQTTSWPHTLAAQSSPLWLAGDGGGTYWSGSLDELFIYHRVLTQADIDRLYQM